MSDESATLDPVELVRRFNEAMYRHDSDVELDLLAADVVYRPIATFPESEERRGRDGYRRFREGLEEAWAAGSSWHLDTIRPYGDAVIALYKFSGRAQASGIEVSGGVFQVYRFRDGKIASIEDFADRDDAVRAAGEQA